MLRVLSVEGVALFASLENVEEVASFESFESVEGFESWECSMSKLSFTALLIHVCIS